MIFNKVITKHSVFSNQISHIGSSMHIRTSVLSKIIDIEFSSTLTGAIGFNLGPNSFNSKIGNRGSSLSCIGYDIYVHIKRTDSKNRVSSIGV